MMRTSQRTRANRTSQTQQNNTQRSTNKSNQNQFSKQLNKQNHSTSGNSRLPQALQSRKSEASNRTEGTLLRPNTQNATNIPPNNDANNRQRIPVTERTDGQLLRPTPPTQTNTANIAPTTDVTATPTTTKPTADEFDYSKLDNAVKYAQSPQEAYEQLQDPFAKERYAARFKEQYGMDISEAPPITQERLNEYKGTIRGLYKESPNFRTMIDSFEPSNNRQVTVTGFYGNKDDSSTTFKTIVPNEQNQAVHDNFIININENAKHNLAFYDPKKQEIYIQSEGNSLPRKLTHELAHVAFSDLENNPQAPEHSHNLDQDFNSLARNKAQRLDAFNNFQYVDEFKQANPNFALAEGKTHQDAMIAQYGPGLITSITNQVLTESESYKEDPRASYQPFSGDNWVTSNGIDITYVRDWLQDLHKEDQNNDGVNNILYFGTP